MRRCIFRAVSYDEAVYVGEYCEEKLEPGCIIVSFTDGNKFMDVIHIDDGDIMCMNIQKEKNKPPVITR